MDIEIGDDIRNELKGQLDDRTVRRYLPSSMKHNEKIREGFAGIMSANTTSIQPKFSASNQVNRRLVVPKSEDSPSP